MRSIPSRFAAVRDRIAGAARAAGREAAEVGLVAVSKRQPPERLAAAVASGHADFGENYPQELARKRGEYPGVRWHLVGHLQRNKAKLVRDAALIHTLDSQRLAQALDRQGAESGRRIPVLVQIHLGGEATKAGIEPGELEPLLDLVRPLSHVDPQGLMTLPPPGEGRRYFAQLRELRDRAQARSGLALPHLSMGMSDDFEDAIAEGATWVRIGTALFGPRPDGPSN